MRPFLCLLALAGAATLSACASQRPPAPQAACDRVTGTATSAGRALAERRAVADLRRQLPDARGELIETGLRGLRTTRVRTECRAYRILGWSTGLTTCTASTLLCGR